MDILNVEYDLENSERLNFHPYQQANILVKGEKVGIIGLVHPKVSLKQFSQLKLI